MRRFARTRIGEQRRVTPLGAARAAVDASRYAGVAGALKRIALSDSVPRCSLLHGLPSPVMLRNQRPRQHVAISARREARLVLADQLLGRRRVGAELRGIQVPTAGDAVNVLMLVAAWARRLSFLFAFG